MLVALVLSLAILFGFQILNPKKQAPVQQTPTAKAQAPVVAAQNIGGAVTPESQTHTPDLPQENEQETIIETEQYKLVFSNIGASLKEVVLKEYSKEEVNEVLQREDEPEKRPFAISSIFSPGLDTKAYAVTKTDTGLEYTLTDPGQLEITKRYTIHKSMDYIELEVLVKNTSGRSMLFNYSIVGPSGMQSPNKVSGRSFLEADTMLDGRLWKKKSVKSPEEKAGIVDWAGLKNRYFTMILKPFETKGSVMLKPTNGKEIMIVYKPAPVDLPSKQVFRSAYLMYAGPLDEGRLGALGYDMQKIVSYGFFGPVSKVLLSILNVYHKAVKNWGLAIILLTLTINILLFPLTKKSFVSMQRMKQIQPHMTSLKEKHKDNPQKLNKEMMELYKQYNVNPLGGCLPMLLQMPIFIALYQGLMRSVSLKGANFLWIKDLAKPDAVPLPFTLPLLGASINILPLLMVGAMFLQQKLSQGAQPTTTNDQASQQKMMMYLFPLFFGFLFYKMPSGLVLYWLTNTILMVTEQTMISNRLERG